MAVRIRILGDGERLVEYREGMTVAEALRSAGLLPGEYVATRGGRVVSDEEELRDGDELLLYPVVSGG